MNGFVHIARQSQTLDVCRNYSNAPLPFAYTNKLVHDIKHYQMHPIKLSVANKQIAINCNVVIFCTKPQSCLSTSLSHWNVSVAAINIMHAYSAWSMSECCSKMWHLWLSFVMSECCYFLQLNHVLDVQKRRIWMNLFHSFFVFDTCLQSQFYRIDKHYYWCWLVIFCWNIHYWKNWMQNSIMWTKLNDF